MTVFYICRHGETENNLTKRLSGWVDTPLTETGLKQTKAVITKLSNVRIDELYSSDIGRAFITAYDIARGLNFTKEIKRLPGLREVNYGDASNMFKADAYMLYPRLDRDTHYVAPNGESLEQMQIRVFRTLDELNRTHSGLNILLVCHSGIMAALMSSFIGQDFGEYHVSEAFSEVCTYDFVGKFYFDNGAVTSFEMLGADYIDNSPN